MEGEREPELRVSRAVGDDDVGQVFQRARVTFCDQLRDARVVPERGEPELGDAGDSTGTVRVSWWRELLVLLVVLC
jgi:hypothetical protein